MWQKQGNIETAWPDVISETKMTPEKVKKPGSKTPKKKAFVPAV